MKIKVNWYGKEYPHDWEFFAECAEGKNIDISVKNSDNQPKNAPSPKEIVLQGMASCTAVDVISMLKKMRQNVTAFTVECEATVTESHPKIFKDCILTYRVTGENLSIERITHSIFLSYTKYCGVHAIIEKSGCHVTPQIFINNSKVNFWDPEDLIAQKLTDWIQNSAKNQPKGLALVVGSSKGIGKAFVEKLVSEGYAVIPTGRTKVQFNHQYIFDSLYLDITKPYTTEYLVEIFSKNDIQLSLLVQNAGIASFESDADGLNTLQLTLDELRYVYETNAFGLMESTNKFISVLTRDATVLLISSTMGLPERDSFYNASYRMSKRTVIQYAKQAALQFLAEKKDFKILSIHPGSVITELNPAGKITVEESAAHLAKILTEKYAEHLKKQNGEFWVYQPETDLWEINR